MWSVHDWTDRSGAAPAPTDESRAAARAARVLRLAAAELEVGEPSEGELDEVVAAARAGRLTRLAVAAALAMRDGTGQLTSEHWFQAGAELELRT